MKARKSITRSKLPRKQWQKLAMATVCSLGTTFLACQQVTANPIEISESEQSIDLIEKYSNENSLNQINNVSQLRDVAPDDWAYEALKSLVERYGCIAGYPNGTFRGDRSMTRYEFAAGLNACLNQMEQIITSASEIVGEDLDKLQKLTEEFRTELVALNGRVDKLEERIVFLEDHQFSTTTKLTGEVVFGVAGVLAGEDAEGVDIDNVPVFGHRTRLGFNTSFDGQDLLYFQLTAGNFPFFSEVTKTFEGDFGLIADNNNQLDLLVAFYSFPIGDSTRVVVEAKGGFVFDFTDTINPLDKLNDSASGSISAFGLRNPIYNTVAGAGVGIQSQLGDNFEVSLGYLAPNADDPSGGNGLFDGAYSAIGQVVFKPSDRFKLGLTYVRGYKANDTLTGSNLANFSSFSEAKFGTRIPTVSDAFGVQTSWQVSSGLILSGWVGYSNIETLATLDTPNGTIERGDLDVWNWAVTLAFPDLGKEGNLGGIVVGMEPKVTNSSIDLPGLEDVDRSTSLHIEAFYQHQLNDNIAITPGIIWITAPDHDSSNSDTVLGILRTTFTF
jgi:hypothetical protein